MMDRYLLRYFLAVVDQGSFSKAALACHVSQPTLSVGIAKLERSLGRSLFNRSNRRVELTEAGVRLLAHARRIEAEFEQAERAVGDTGEHRVLRLGILTTIPWVWIDAVLKGLDDDRLGHRLELVEGRERDLLDRLARGRIDVAVNLLRPGSVRFAEERLYSEGYSLALPERHPLAEESVVEAAQLMGSPMILRRHCELLSDTSRFFTARGVRPAFPARTTSDRRALDYVAAGLGATVAPDGFTHPGVARRLMADFPFERTIGLQFAAHTDVPAMLRHAVIERVAGELTRLSDQSN